MTNKLGERKIKKYIFDIYICSSFLSTVAYFLEATELFNIVVFWQFS